MTVNRAEFANLRAVSVGHVTHDRYGESLVAGGCAYYGAQAFHRLGAHTQLLTTVGHDFAVFDAVEPFETRLTFGGHTTVFSNIYPPGQSRVQIVESQAPGLKASQFPAEFRGADVLFVAPVMGEMMEPGWVEAANARVVCGGLQGFLKVGAEAMGSGRLVRGRRDMVDMKLFHGFDAAFLSEEDLELVAHLDFLAKVREVVPIVVVTAGERGCKVYEGADVSDVGVFSTTCVDPTGAGDTFAAAMSLGLGAGLSTKNAAKFGAAAASVIVEGWGPQTVAELGKAFDRFTHVV